MTRKHNQITSSYSTSFGVTGSKVIQVLSDVKTLIDSLNQLMGQFVSGDSGGFGSLLNCSKIFKLIN